MSQPWCAINVRVFADQDGLLTIVPPDIEFTPTDGMKEVSGVKDIDVVLHLGKPAQVRILAFVGGTVMNGLVPTYLAVDPSSGEIKEVQHVKYADGTEWNPYP
jgi:hypothetical protein